MWNFNATHYSNTVYNFLQIPNMHKEGTTPKRLTCSNLISARPILKLSVEFSNIVLACNKPSKYVTMLPPSMTLTLHVLVWILVLVHRLIIRDFNYVNLKRRPRFICLFIRKYCPFRQIDAILVERDITLEPTFILSNNSELNWLISNEYASIILQFPKFIRCVISLWYLFL